MQARNIAALTASAASFLVLASASAAQADTTRTGAAASQSTPAERRLNPQPEPPGVAAMRRTTPAEPRTANSRQADPWQRVVTKRYTPETLGLTRDASARALARAAIERSARSLGVRRRSGIRFASESAPTAAPAGGRRLRTLRFRQTVGGLRVLWSEIDVAVVEDAVTSISATTVPFTQTKLVGQRQVTRARARALAKRAQPGAEQALPAQPVAYAGTPGKPWAPRRAWVVQVQPAKQPRHTDATETICVVVNASSGKILMRYKGFVSPGDTANRRPRARSSGTGVLESIFDAKGLTGIGEEVGSYEGSLSGSFGFRATAVDWPQRPAIAHVVFKMLTPLIVACQARDFCVDQSVIHGRLVRVQAINANSGDPLGSHYSTNGDLITLGTKHSDNLDVMAHEFGHRRDRTWADERVEGHRQVDEVEEALADMFAYDFDHDPSMFEDSRLDFDGDQLKTGNRRDLSRPSKYSIDGRPYPDTMADYRCGTADSHINATILGHAYYRFADQVGHQIAGDVLTYIPYALPAAPSFNNVAYWFGQRSLELYGPSVAQAANHAFRVGAGIGGQSPVCGSSSPSPANPPSVCELRPSPPPVCFGQSPPTRPELDPPVTE